MSDRNFYKLDLVGKKIKIIVSEPWGWKEGNLFGTITLAEEKKLLIELSKEIKGPKLTSDLLELDTRYADDTFRMLTKSGSITVNGSLIKKNSTVFDYIIIGSVILDS